MRIFIVAGPNGAGKTTFARFFLKAYPQITHYLNADLIATGLAPLQPEAAAVEAGRFLLKQMDHLVLQRVSFAFETTLSALNYLRRVQSWQKTGYLVELIFLRLPSPEFAINRVKQRVVQGGHNIPIEVIQRRFGRGLNNLVLYKKVVNAWRVYDSSHTHPVLVERYAK